MLKDKILISKRRPHVLYWGKPKSLVNRTESMADNMKGMSLNRAPFVASRLNPKRHKA